MRAYQFHEVASIFPMMTDSEYDDLVSDVRKNGLLEPIWLYEGRIIDGRNRYQACVEAGVEPRFREWDGKGSLVGFVVSLNLHRRQLTSSQRAMVAVEMLPLLEKEAKERQACGQGGVLLSQKIDEATGRASDQAAKITGTNRQYVSDAKKISTEAPELAEKIKVGELTITQAKREIKEQKREERREQNRQLIQSTPEPTKVIAAKFATIMLDPPWDWGDEGDCDQLGRAKPTYDTMSFSRLLELPVDKLADDDCHIYMWITNRSMPKGFALIEKWGFRYVTLLTWPKPHFGMGNYFRGQTEHLLFGVKGSQQLRRKDASTLLPQWKRGPNGHSSKPEEIYEFIESCSPGPYLEMFSRGSRGGWVVWGAEANAA